MRGTRSNCNTGCTSSSVSMTMTITTILLLLLLQLLMTVMTGADPHMVWCHRLCHHHSSWRLMLPLSKEYTLNTVKGKTRVVFLLYFTSLHQFGNLVTKCSM